MRTLVLRSARLRAAIAPDVGASLARFDQVAGAVARPVLRPFSAAPGVEPRPGLMACFALLPWSNRMAGGFSFGGRHYPIAPNRSDDPYPMHGHGWQRAWDVVEQTEARAVLALDCHAAPFSYRARITYALDDCALAITLDVLNTGGAALPFGLGLHPWLPRSEQVTLQAKAQRVWLAGADRLPGSCEAIPPPWSFAQARALPEGLIDNVFEGWDGYAEVRWPDTGMSLKIESDYNYYIVYAPPGKDFFCFEPVDHRIDAHNGQGGPQRHGLTILEPGRSLSRHCRFEVA